MEEKKGKLYVVGIGPGNYEEMTLRAIKALEESDVIAGYTVYCDLVRDRFPDKEYIVTAMTGEEKRVGMALAAASEGKTVSLVCSGDPGVYGMAGLAITMAAEAAAEDAAADDGRPAGPGCDREARPQARAVIEVEVIPGVTAALSGAALLGAPLIHDFCVISLSDRLTPMALIEKRLRLAAEADLGIVLYNPESRSRKGYLARACDILSEKIEPGRVCGIVRYIGREGESMQVMPFSELREAKADMFSTVFIGNSGTRNILGSMVTIRGYKSEKNARTTRLAFLEAARSASSSCPCLCPLRGHDHKSEKSL